MAWPWIVGSRGGSAPNPWSERHVTTRFLRVPLVDWPAVKIGRKTEYRRPVSTRAPIFPYTPTPVVAYALRGKTYDHRLMVLESIRQETLWQIRDSPESLEREGMETYEQFRAYWKARTRKYLPLAVVYVYRVMPWMPGDEQAMGAELIGHLYKDFLP